MKKPRQNAFFFLLCIQLSFWKCRKKLTEGRTCRKKTSGRRMKNRKGEADYNGEKEEKARKCGKEDKTKKLKIVMDWKIIEFQPLNPHSVSG